MKYYFVEPLNKQFDEELKKRFNKQSSDLACNPEGYILSDEELNEFTVIKSRQHRMYKLWDIPEQYQNNIDLFIEEYWDGDVIIKETLK